MRQPQREGYEQGNHSQELLYRRIPLCKARRRLLEDFTNSFDIEEDRFQDVYDPEG
jgi:hypothetical protein